jgi:hypothetical protein
LEPVTKRIIHEAQTTFIGGRSIMNNVLALHEVLHETKRKGECRVVLKLDFENAYDKVNWSFLRQCLVLRGFSETWCGWVQKVVQDRTIAIKLNDMVGPYFQSFKGVRHGDPLSPLLFNLGVDCLTRMVVRAQQNNLIIGLIKHLIPGGVVILQYAYDTIMCLEHNVEKTRNLKLLLYMFEQLSGLKINFDKIEIIVVGGMIMLL